MEKRDIIVSLIIGEIVSWFALGIIKNLAVGRLEVFGIEIEEKILYLVLPVLFPILALAVILISWVLSRKIFVIWQIAKFVLVGVLNTFVDLGVLNILIFVSGIVSGPAYSLFKGISFVVAATNSYFWNRFWVFGGKRTADKIGEAKAGKEFLQFFVVSVIGFIINVGTASLIVFSGPQFGLGPKTWANIGAIVAAFAGMTWNFLGYKFIVFKK